MEEVLEDALQKGEVLPIMEHFYTLQGEGAFTGMASYFIRIGGCDVGCHWCDVKESWDKDIHPATDIKEVVETASNTSETIVLTGGEPLMYNLNLLCKSLKVKSCKVHLETSGAYPLTGEFDWITFSPKKNLKPLSAIYNVANELKVIIYNQHDFQFAEEEAKKVNKNAVLYLQPEWSNQEKMIPSIINYVKENPKWRLSLQTHKYLNIP